MTRPKQFNRKRKSDQMNNTGGADSNFGGKRVNIREIGARKMFLHNQRPSPFPFFSFAGDRQTHVFFSPLISVQIQLFTLRTRIWMHSSIILSFMHWFMGSVLVEYVLRSKPLVRTVTDLVPSSELVLISRLCCSAMSNSAASTEINPLSNLTKRATRVKIWIVSKILLMIQTMAQN